MTATSSQNPGPAQMRHSRRFITYSSVLYCAISSVWWRVMELGRQISRGFMAAKSVPRTERMERLKSQLQWDDVWAN